MPTPVPTVPVIAGFVLGLSVSVLKDSCLSTPTRQAERWMLRPQGTHWWLRRHRRAESGKRPSEYLYVGASRLRP